MRHNTKKSPITTIALEDLVTLVCTEFVKQYKPELQYYSDARSYRIPYLTMNMAKRRKISEKILERLEKY